MEQVLKFITSNALVLSLAGGTLATILSIVAKRIPKKKLMDIVPETTPKFDKLMFGFGVAFSVFGVSRIGKKAMESLEEGIIQTLLATLMAWTTRGCNILINGIISFGKGLMSDNK